MSKLDLIKRCLDERCLLEIKWKLSWYKRWFYTFKCIVCILFDWRYKGKNWMNYTDYVVVAIHSFVSTYNYGFGVETASFVDIVVSLNKWLYYELPDGWI